MYGHGTHCQQQTGVVAGCGGAEEHIVSLTEMSLTLKVAYREYTATDLQSWDLKQVLKQCISISALLVAKGHIIKVLLYCFTSDTHIHACTHTHRHAARTCTRTHTHTHTHKQQVHSTYPYPISSSLLVGVLCPWVGCSLGSSKSSLLGVHLSWLVGHPWHLLPGEGGPSWSSLGLRWTQTEIHVYHTLHTTPKRIRHTHACSLYIYPYYYYCMYANSILYLLLFISPEELKGSNNTHSIVLHFI